MRFLYKLIFLKALKWRIVGQVPEEKKYIIVVAPHTSNYDFMIGLAVRSIMGFKASFLGKKELFRWPFGWLFRKLGGYPVDRSKHTNLVDAVAAIFNEHEKFAIAIAPEGTRKYVKDWKSGFYYMALKAKVPLLLAAIDYKTKTVYFSQPYFPTGNKTIDSKNILSFYAGHEGKYPKKLPDSLFGI
jgi:1-acyl-sn-glycerol-3-phosphate acyltransferase